MKTFLLILLYMSIGFGVWLIGIIHGDFDPSDYEDGGPGIITCCFFWPGLVALFILVVIAENSEKLAKRIQKKVNDEKNGRYN